MHIISITNHKGGVGKTTTTLNLGKALAILGKRVLIIDNDPQSNLTTICGINNPQKTIYTVLSQKNSNISLPIEPVTENLDIVPCELDYSRCERSLIQDYQPSMRIKLAIEATDMDYDFVFIDCPPSLGILSVNAFAASTFVLVVVEASPLSVRGLQSVIDTITDIKAGINNTLKIIGFLITKANNFVIRKDMASQVKEHYQDEVFKTLIRAGVAIEEASSLNQDIFTYDPESRGAKDYADLADEFMERINNFF